ncbi:MAG: hypothetical protein ACTHMC_27785 [Pseudobacter sp.]|uniref:hypothetical protein n=1 Tax=Pseudobacter sp. TaxID=2045420 RepID=UPI003F7E1B99
MKSTVLTSLWFPVLLLIVQTLMISFVCNLALRWMGLLRKPYNGMENGMMAYAGSLLLGMIIIAAADAESLFQSTRVYLDSQPNPLLFTVSQFTRLFLVVMIIGLLFLAINYAIFKWIVRGKTDELELPSSILLTSIALGTIVVCWQIAKEITSLMTPLLIGLG